MLNVINRNETEFCGKVPLHQTNLLQPHGYLLIVEKETFRILQAGENITPLCNLPAQQLVNTSLSEYIPAEEMEKIRSRFSRQVSGSLPFFLPFPSGVYLATIKAQDAYFVFEIEKDSRPASGRDLFIDIYQDLKYVMAAIDEAGTTLEACRVAIEELKKISGFDKIMAYQFDEDWNGDVIAEVMEEGMDSYLGLKFPASDIPKQARELYRKTPFRLIPNTRYDAVKIYPVINPLTNVFTDLSDSNLRSVAGVHIEYLRNMKVTASMSTRILKNDKLWGLIACHHREAKYLSFEKCAIFELLSNVLSAKVSAMQNQDQFHYQSQMQELHTDLVEEVFRENDLVKGLKSGDQKLLQLLKADGVALVLSKNIETIGKVPAEQDIEDLVIWLQSANRNKIYHQPSLSAVFEPAEHYAQEASGLLALPVQAEKGCFILAFRPEAVTKVNWGGNPEEALHFEADGKRYHPRASFRLWQQQVVKTSLPWRGAELEVAEQFRNFVVEYTLNKVQN